MKPSDKSYNLYLDKINRNPIYYLKYTIRAVIKEIPLTFIDNLIGCWEALKDLLSNLFWASLILLIWLIPPLSIPLMAYLLYLNDKKEIKWFEERFESFFKEFPDKLKGGKYE